MRISFSSTSLNVTRCKTQVARCLIPAQMPVRCLRRRVVETNATCLSLLLNFTDV